MRRVGTHLLAPRNTLEATATCFFFRASVFGSLVQAEYARVKRNTLGRKRNTLGRRRNTLERLSAEYARAKKHQARTKNTPRQKQSMKTHKHGLVVITVARIH